MANKIVLKKSSVTNKVPLTTDLDYGELALNYTDGKLYYKKSDGTTIDSFNAGALYSDSNVDSHLNTSTATSGQVLGWSGSDYDWITPSTGGSSTLTIYNKTAAYTVVAGDLGAIINCTSGTFTVSLTAAATLGSGFNVTIWNTSTTAGAAITIDPNGTETIDGVGTLILRRGEGMQIVCDGTNWQTGDKKTMRGYAENCFISGPRPVASASGAVAIGVPPQMGVAAITASAVGSFAAGSNSTNQGSQAITGAGAMALGGSYASGMDSFAAAVGNNTSGYGATGQYAIAIGQQVNATGNYSIALSQMSTASGSNSFARGLNCLASGAFSEATGSGSIASEYGKRAYASGYFSFRDAQHGLLVLRQSTTTATAIALTTDGAAASTTNQVILPNNSAYAFTGTIVARRKASEGTQAAAWRVEGLIRREGTAASTVLVNSALTVIDNTPGWTLALSADTTNGGLAITATGSAATNIRWVATIQTSEVTYT